MFRISVFGMLRKLADDEFGMPIQVQICFLEISILLAYCGFCQQHLGRSKPVLERSVWNKFEVLRLADDLFDVQWPRDGYVVS